MNSLITLSPKQLRKAADIQERILKLQDELQTILGVPTATASPTPELPAKKRKFSAAARAKMRKAQRERWAKIKGVKATETLGAKPKRKMSAAGRAAISAAAKARWAKMRAAGKTRL